MILIPTNILEEVGRHGFDDKSDPRIAEVVKVTGSTMIPSEVRLLRREFWGGLGKSRNWPEKRDLTLQIFHDNKVIYGAPLNPREYHALLFLDLILFQPEVTQEKVDKFWKTLP